ncbi:MAG: T9SS type A sorting domain-containing protein [Calditrichaeota bacterium]|nr:T9SS type A sorting domain-containing protein [Calditrichota bacterium]
MLKVIFFVCFSFFLLSTSFSQPITGILVNDEPDTNNFRVTDASLHYFSPDSFLATWHDTRSNGNFAWAQFFDGHEQEMSQVFRIAGNNVIVTGNNSSYSVVDYHYKYLASFFDPLWVGRLQNYIGMQPNGNPLRLRVHLFPPCGTGFVGIGDDFVRTTWGGIHADNFGGYLNWAIQDGFDPVAPLSWNEIFFGDWLPVQTVSHFDLCPTPDHAGAFLIFCSVDIGFGQDDKPGLHFVHIKQSTTELDARQILADSTLTFSGRNDNYISATFLDSNVIHILWAKKDSLIEIEMDTLGNIQFKKSLPIPTIELPNFQLKDFAVNSLLISNARKGRSYALLGCYQYGNRGNERKSEDFFVIYALQDGKLTAEPPRVVPVAQWNTNLTSGDAFLQDNGMLILEGVEDDNAYLFQLDGEQIVDKTKLSSEAPGDNQRRPLILPETNDSFWVTFDEAGKRKGRRLRVNGNLYEQVENKPQQGGIFLENGQTFVALGQSTRTSPATMAIQFYNANNWIFRFEILVSEHRNAILIEKMDENHFFALFRKASQITQLKVFNSEGTVLDSLSAQSQVPGNNFPIASFPLNDGKFWLKTDRYFLWDPAANSIKEATSLPQYFIGTPISADQFVHGISSLNYEELAFGSTYTIIDVGGQELIKDHSISGGDHYFKILPLNDDYFLIFYQTNDQKYYFQVFDHSFQSVLKEEPFPKATRNSVGGTAMVIGSHVVFAISDIRNDITGQDIYASIFDLHDIISKVTNQPFQEQQPLTFELSNPSPNPVRVGQRVGFNLNVFKRHYFEISIYNILGQQVGETKKRTYSRGEHRIEFKLYDFAAGLYFVRATTENRSMIKKVLVTSK